MGVGRKFAFFEYFGGLEECTLSSEVLGMEESTLSSKVLGMEESTLSSKVFRG